MVARAHAQAVREGHHIDLTVARSQVLPYADQTFDVVTCVTVLTFIADPEVAVREMARVLRPGGRLVIGDLGKWSYWAARRRIRGWLGATLWRAARFRSANELAATIKRGGLTIHAIRGAIFFPPWVPLDRLMAPFDLSLGRATRFGAAFVAIQATRP
jgi:SAM-dependent methyltransferase